LTSGGWRGSCDGHPAATMEKPDPILLNDWHVVARASELGAGLPRTARLLGVDLVVWRGDSGVQVWDDLCIHRGAKLSGGKVRDGCLHCPYHGWTYNAEGACVAIPAQPSQKPPPRAHARVHPVRIAYDLVWTCLGEPTQEPPPFPEWDDPSYRRIPSGPYAFNALGPRVIENFLDVGHFPFVHAGYLGDPGHTEIEDYEAEITATGVIARDIPIWQPDPDGTGKSAKVLYTYEALRPLTARFTKKLGEQRFSMIDIVTPVDESRSLAWAIMVINYGFDAPIETFVTFQDAVTAQDLPIVESQRPEMLPLDLQAELHLRSDRTAIAYRKWLRQLGLRYGTS
jgi:phenylpropionate dioxygenase-like ring-hydroxylating dioxygenase large terminal subunit